MTDLPSSLGIEAVEVTGEDGRSVTVRVTGRWRRRRPELRGQAMLVVETESGRQRFPAMPEPPSLTGAAPGTWRMSFSIPATLARSLPDSTFLQLGGMMVRLPVGEVATVGSDGLEERRAGGSELAAESARRRAAGLAGEVVRLEHELDGARARSERLRVQITERERRLRVAEQHIHAERARRGEVEQELSRTARAAEHDLRALTERVTELGRRLTRMRRAVDEAEHLAAVAVARRAQAERRVPALEAELAAAREEIEAQRRGSDRAYAAIDLIRAELRQLPTGPPAHAARASPAPSSLGPPLAAVPQAAPVQAERLSAALARLREQAVPVTESPPTAPAEPAPRAGAARPWLAPVFRALAVQDAPVAGRLLLALLPAQRAADPHPVAYDLVLGDVACAHVTVGSTGSQVDMDATPRAPAELDFTLEGNLAGIARLLAAGRLRRRLRLGLWPGATRLRGDRRKLVSLDRLIGARLTLRELYGAGVRLDPVLAMTVFGLMVEPVWTRGERFVIGHRDPAGVSADAYLQVRDGVSPLASSGPPRHAVETVVVYPPAELVGVLAGVAIPADVVGEQRPLRVLRQWLDRAQCG